MQVYRGDIFFVEKYKPVVGSEQEQGRPAIVVSNDMNNEFSNCVEVVYMTSQAKNPLPTHVDIMCKIPSIALCEQVHTVSKDRLSEFVRACSEEEMKQINEALMISLELQETAKSKPSAPKEKAVTVCAEKPEKKENQAEMIRIETEKELYKDLYEKLLTRLLEK